MQKHNVLLRYLVKVCVDCDYITFHTVASFTEFLPLIFKIEGVTCFLTEQLSQDPLEKFFGARDKKEGPMKILWLVSF